MIFWAREEAIYKFGIQMCRTNEFASIGMYRGRQKFSIEIRVYVQIQHFITRKWFIDCVEFETKSDIGYRHMRDFC